MCAPTSTSIQFALYLKKKILNKASDKKSIWSLITIHKPTTPTSHPHHLQFTIFISPNNQQKKKTKNHVWSKTWSPNPPYSHLQPHLTHQRKMGRREYRIPGSKNIRKLSELQESQGSRGWYRGRFGFFVAAVVEDELQAPLAELEVPGYSQRPMGAHGDGQNHARIVLRAFAEGYRRAPYQSAVRRGPFGWWWESLGEKTVEGG